MKTTIVVASVLGLTSTMLGAFGAHALQDKLTVQQLQSFETAVRYQMYHALALFAVSWVSLLGGGRLAVASALCMVVGVVLFSGSIYGLVLFEWKWLGPVTPLGGILMMAGWVLLAISCAKLSLSETRR